MRNRFLLALLIGLVLVPATAVAHVSSFQITDWTATGSGVTSGVGDVICTPGERFQVHVKIVQETQQAIGYEAKGHSPRMDCTGEGIGWAVPITDTIGTYDGCGALTQIRARVKTKLDGRPHGSAADTDSFISGGNC